jgi:hypothetical protein
VFEAQMKSEDELKEDTIKFPMDVIYLNYRICLIEWMIISNFTHFGNLDISVMYSMESLALLTAQYRKSLV